MDNPGHVYTTSVPDADAPTDDEGRALINAGLREIEFMCEGRVLLIVVMQPSGNYVLMEPNTKDVDFERCLLKLQRVIDYLNGR